MSYPWNPNDTLTAADLNAAIGMAAGTGGAGSDNTGRNLIHNSMMAVAQRGLGPFTTGMTLDRWRIENNLDASNVSQAAASDGTRSGIGDEAVDYFAAFVIAGNAGAGYSTIRQAIENVRRLAGKTVTLSFWAVANAGTPKIGISFDQVFGTGGTTPAPSPTVVGNGQAVTISNAWARYSVTTTLPSVANKTLGTNNDSCTYVWFWFSSGTTQAARAGNIGVQTHNPNIWGVQLEIGSVATPLEKLDPVTQLQQCQRFFQTGLIQSIAVGAAGAGYSATAFFPTALRGVPPVTVTITGTPTLVNMPSVAVQGSGTAYAIFQGTATAAGATGFILTYTASADL